MAEGGEHPSVNSPVTEELLVTVAEKLFHQHLRNFATTLVGLDAAEYNDIVKDPVDNAGKQCLEVSFSFFLSFAKSRRYLGLSVSSSFYFRNDNISFVATTCVPLHIFL